LNDQQSMAIGSGPEPQDRGRQASTPTDVPPSGWLDIVRRTLAEAKQDRVTLLAAGVAFFFFLALVPLLVVIVSMYGMLASPAEIRQFASDFLAAAPREVRQLVTSQLQTIARSSNGRAIFGAIVGILVALWSASTGVSHLVAAVNAAFDEEDRRRAWRRRGLSLCLTLGALAFGVVAVVVIAVLPSALAGSDLAAGTRWAIDILRWPLLAGGMLVGLAVLYRFAPDRSDARWAWVTPGALLGVGIWLAGSALFSLYAANFGRFQATYGSLASIVVLLVWLFVSAYAVLLGAELNAESERQTFRDTTTGPALPLGNRGAYAADTVGPSRPRRPWRLPGGAGRPT
jgi:membrane protein